MFDAHIGSINLTWLVIIVAVIVVLPVQIFLCFKVKSLILRLLPIILFITLILISVVMYFISTGWDGLIYILFGIYGVGLVLVSSVGWVIWKIVARRTK